MNKRPGGRDKRQDPDDDEAPPAANYRVDRVFAPAPVIRPRPHNLGTSPPATEAASPAGQMAAMAAASAEAAASLAAATSTAVAAGRTPTGGEAADTELSLRRQLSRLQRQLSEAQQELANRDDELAGEVEKRLAIGAAHDAVIDENRALIAQLDELTAYQARTEGVETRLLEIVTTAEELSLERDREREQRVAAQSRVAELAAALERQQERARKERDELAAAHAQELERLETQKRLALDNAEEAITATTMRLREANDDALAQLRETHERTLASLRGELEPRALAARTLEEEREQLRGELEALTAKAARDARERDEAYQRELAQVEELHESERAVQERLFQSELTRAHDERDAQTRALEQATHEAAQREQVWEDTVASMREVHKTLQIELATLEERCAQLEADKASAEDRHATSAMQVKSLIVELRALRDRLDASENEARRNALDRRRFVAYLEEGLALLGALPAAAKVAGPALEDTVAGAIDPTGETVITVSDATDD